MTAPGSELNNKRTVQTQAQITANDDTSVTVTGVTLPSSSGAYGPFRLITRQYQEGEIYDISNSFASIYVTPSAGADGTLTVTSHDGEPVKVLSATKLDF